MVMIIIYDSSGKISILFFMYDIISKIDNEMLVGLGDFIYKL